jgi:hypothetical protein
MNRSSSLLFHSLCQHRLSRTPQPAPPIHRVPGSRHQFAGRQQKILFAIRRSNSASVGDSLYNGFLIRTGRRPNIEDDIGASIPRGSRRNIPDAVDLHVPSWAAVVFRASSRISASTAHQALEEIPWWWHTSPTSSAKAPHLRRPSDLLFGLPPPAARKVVDSNPLGSLKVGSRAAVLWSQFAGRKRRLCWALQVCDPDRGGGRFAAASPMSILRHREVFPSSAPTSRPTSRLIVWMSFHLVVPWRVALQQRPPPHHQPCTSMLQYPLAGGEVFIERYAQ